MQYFEQWDERKDPAANLKLSCKYLKINTTFSSSKKLRINNGMCDVNIRIPYRM